MPLLAKDANSSSIQVLRHGSTEAVAYTGTAAASSALSKGVYRVVSTTDCHFSLDGTATSSDVFMPAGSVEFVRTNAGDAISFIQSASGGTAYVTEMV
jgi:ribosomal protein L18